ncbi:MAG: hypothetical protein ACYCPQ_00570 [Elusimicrobiota bacterium]
MKTTSAAFKLAQASSLIYPVRKIELFRLLPDGSAWEANPTDVSAEVVKLDRLAWKLDTDALNEFKASNLQIEVDNSDRRWDDGSPGRFAGYLRGRSKLRISLGLNLNGAAEAFPVFTGLIANTLERTPQPILQLDVQSLDVLLDDALANNAAILVTNELIGTGDGLTSNFNLSQFPVGEVLAVRLNGVAVKPGLWWTSNNLNNPALPGSVSFPNIAPPPGAAITADYIVWKTNQQVAQVVNDLVNAVPLVQKGEIDQVIFSPPAPVERVQHTIGDFSAWGLANLLVQPKPLPAGASPLPNPPPPTAEGQLAINPFNTRARWYSNPVWSNIDFDHTPNAIQPQWSSQYEADIDPSAEDIIANALGMSYRWEEFYGSATITMAGSVRTITQSGANNYLLYNSYETPVSYGTPPSPRCVCARLAIPTLAGPNSSVILGGTFGATGVGAQIEFPNTTSVRVRSAAASASYSLDATQFHAYRLAMIPAPGTPFNSPPTGTWVLYVDGVQVLTGPMETLGSAPGQYAPVSPLTAGVNLVASIQAGGSLVLSIDFLRFNSLDSNPPIGSLTVKTAYGDALAAVVNFALITNLGPFFAALQGQPSDAQFFFSWSADDLTYSPEVEVPLNGNLGSWQNFDSPQFVKLRIVLTDHLNSTEIAVTNLLLPGLAVSPAINGGTGVVSWDSWTSGTALNGGQIQRFTEAAANTTSGYSFAQPVGPDPADAILSGSFSQSQGFGMPNTIRLIALVNPASPASPVLLWNDVKFTTDTIAITMADFSGRTVWDVLKELAQLADYEVGMDSNGAFFFRDKVPEPVSLLTLDGLNVLSLQSLSPGWDRIYNHVEATFGSDKKVVDSVSEQEPAPTSMQRFGVKVLAVGSSQLLYATDVDYATALGRRYFYRYKEPKRQATLIARFMPELELGDRVTMSIAIPRPVGQAFDAKVIGIAHDLMKFTSELDLLEV